MVDEGARCNALHPPLSPLWNSCESRSRIATRTISTLIELRIPRIGGQLQRKVKQRRKTPLERVEDLDLSRERDETRAPFGFSTDGLLTSKVMVVTNQIVGVRQLLRQAARVEPEAPYRRYARFDSAAALLCAAAAAAGVLLGLGAAWPTAWPLTWMASSGFVFLIIALSRRSAAQGFIGLMLAVAAWQAAGMGWVALAVRDSAFTNAWQLGVLAVALATQLVPAAAVWCLLRWVARRAGSEFERDAWLVGLHVGLALACAETLRQFGWWGHGYARLSTAFLDMPGARLVVPVVGAAGWGWLVWLSATLLAGALWFCLSGARCARRWTVGLLGLGAVAWGLLAWSEARSAATWTAARPDAEVSLIVVQPPAERGRRWTRPMRDDAIAQLEAAIKSASPGTVLVTSETFFSEPPPRQADGRWADLLGLVRSRGVHALIGMPYLLRDPEGTHMMNAVVQISPHRGSLYAKERLVPGGEYLPWPEMLAPLYERIFEKVRTGQRSAPPELTQVLFAGGESIGVSICHELSFPLTMAERASGASWLVNLADDVWIDSDLYHRQMLAIARLRAMESGKPLLRVSQGAPSVLIGPGGEVMAGAADAGALNLPLQLVPHDGSTPYQRMAMWLAAAPVALAACWCVWALRRRLFSTEANSR
jgi:apolipoprotein N-acyltransferase